MEKTRKLKDFLTGATSIFIILFLVLIIKLNLLLSLIIVMIGLFGRYHYSKHDIEKTIKQSFSLNIILMVIGVMIFKNMLRESGVVEALPPLLMGLGIPTPFVIFMLPFIVGVMTGMSTAFVAITFPIVLGLTGNTELWPIAFAYASGFAGIMLTPMHLCLALTVDFYKAKLGRVLCMLAVPMAALIAVVYSITYVF